MAIIHIAMFDAMNAATPTFRSYTGIKAKGGAHSIDAALSQAAHDTLVALYPSQAPAFDAFLAEDLFRIKSKNEKANGIELGQRVAAAILAMRAHDGQKRRSQRWASGT